MNSDSQAALRTQADEELLLLEGVDMAGLGNWAAVAEHVGTKSQETCKQHYYDIYISSPAFPEPMPAPSMASIDKLQVLSSLCYRNSLAGLSSCR